jgi:photosystem II stability/assembly factor-like uncharacterized protein
VKVALRGLVVLVVAAVATQSGAAAPARTSRQAVRAESGLFWTTRTGLVGLGSCVPGGIHCAGGAVERTTDGGRTYHVVLRTSGPVGLLTKVGSRGAIATPSSGHAWRTLNRGRTWKPYDYRPLFWATPRLAIRFTSVIRGSDTKLALQVTHDGGRTWQRLPDPCNHAVTYNAYASLVTTKLWWIVCVGVPAGGTADKAVFSTRDGGKTWRTGAENLGPPHVRIHGGIGLFGSPDALAFARDGFGLLTEAHGTLYLTHDGGQHFEAQQKIVQRDVDLAAGAAAFSGGVAYVLLTGKAGFPARLVETRDSGRTWQVMHRWSGS